MEGGRRSICDFPYLGRKWNTIQHVTESINIATWGPNVNKVQWEIYQRYVSMIITLMRGIGSSDLWASASAFTPKALDRRYSLGDKAHNALVYFTETIPYPEVMQPPIWVEMPLHTQSSDFLS
jgi:hypothetical protein